MKIWDMAFFGTDLYHVVHWLLIYSILGWIVESIYMSICNRKLTNRGFIHGPMCPIYGVGALTVYFVLRPLESNWVALYFGGTFLATTLEYITAILMQKVFGCIWWDYNDKPFNYKGILCLESSIAWGFYTLFLFLFLQKWVEKLVGIYPRHIGIYLGMGLIIYYMVDFAVSLVGAIDLNVKLKKLSAIVDEMQERLGKIHIVPKREHIFERLESYISPDTTGLPDIGIKELAEKYRTMRAKNSFLSRHFIKSYQAFKIWRRKETEKEQEQVNQKDIENVGMEPIMKPIIEETGIK